MKTILVTGHNGFIGSHLTSMLLKKFQIVGLSNKIKPNSSIIQIKKDIRNVTVSNLPKEIFCIIQLAALTDVNYCNNHPSECFKVNVLGTQRMLEIARKKNTKFIYFSTSHVFGIPKKIPISENSPKNPTSLYSASKLAGEILSESYSKTYGLDVSIPRLFSVYGPNSPKHLVTSKIIQQLLNGDTIKLGNLSPKRDFIYIDDVLYAINIILKNTKGFNTYNIGYGKSYSIKQVCDSLVQIADKKVKIKSQKTLSRKGDISNIVADRSKLKKLGWAPQINLNNGLKSSYDWFKSNSK